VGKSQPTVSHHLSLLADAGLITKVNRAGGCCARSSLSASPACATCCRSEVTIDVRAMAASDWPAVEAIYAAGIATGNATFETTPPTWETFHASKRPDQRWVAVDDEVVAGRRLESDPVSRACLLGRTARD
jgi:hypothetical protein